MATVNDQPTVVTSHATPGPRVSRAGHEPMIDVLAGWFDEIAASSDPAGDAEQLVEWCAERGVTITAASDPDALVGVPTAPVDPDVGESEGAGPEAPHLPTPLAEGPVQHPDE